MGNPLYAVRETGLCPACRFPRDSTYHFRLHVPRDRWPASMGKSAPRVEHGPYERAVAFSEYEAVIDVLDAVIEANDADTCEVCGLRGGGDDCPHIDVFAAVSGEASAPGSHALPEVVDAGVAPSPEAAITCECGWAVPADSGNPAGAYRLHRAKAKQHREVTA